MTFKELAYLVIAIIFGAPILTLLSVILIESIKTLLRRLFK